MNHSLLSPTGNLIPSSWAIDSLRAVRNALQAEGRDDLALAISEAIGGLTARDASNTPGDDDYEDLDPESSDPEWPVWTDRETWTLGEPDADGPTPDDVLELDDANREHDELRELVDAFELPAISGGAPFEPSEADWEDFHSWVDATDDGRFTEADARAAGLAV